MSHMQQFDIQPHILTRFSILKKIGSGAYGHVWKVQEKSTRKIYALKKIFDAFQHATDAQRTYRQIQVLKQLSHPNIIRLYETLKAQNNKDVYLIFQYMEADLHNVIAQGILKEVHIRFIIYQLAKALKYMHSGLIIHRDLKPSNILINSNCSIKLCDFGLVRTLMRQGESNSILTQGVATRWYRAPEVLFGSTSYSTPADIWSFGCIIYEILVQKPMFPGESTTDQLDKIISYTGYPTDEQLRSMKSQQARGMLKQSKIHFYTPNIKQTLKDLPPLLGQLIKKMTALNPKERITIEQILNHEVVQPFRKKEQQLQCQKIISLGVSDDKKLTVDEYRNLVYGIKTIQSRDSVKFMSSAKKSLSSTQISQNYPKFSTPLDHKYQLKYVKSKQLLNYNNKSVQLQTSEYSKFKEQKTADSRKDILFDPTRLTYISKTFYTPKNYNSSTPSQASQKTQGSWHGYPQSQNSSIMTTNSSKQMPHTTTSSSSGYTKPMLFKSSKYVIHKTEQSQKDHK